MKIFQVYLPTALLAVLLLMTDAQLSAQQYDSLKTKPLLTKMILPAALLTSGIIINNSLFEKNVQTDLRNFAGNDFRVRADDYLQFVPVVIMYTADITGVKSKNHWFDQSKYLFFSQFISGAIVYGLKYLTNKTRPDGSVHSFPSGHTESAFTNAGILYHEFRKSAPTLAYSGYLFAISTGTLRMLNNRHYLSDVLTGAAIGMIVTDLVYYFEPLKHWNPFKKMKTQLSLYPKIDRYGYGFYFSCRF